MPLRSLFAASAVTFTLASACLAGDAVSVMDPYARASTANAKSGAAFMVLMNHTDTDDRLIGAASDVAKRVELHTHKENADGVMQMLHDKDGFEIPAGGKHMLMRGGDHVMFMGLTKSLKDGDTVSLTLTFEKAGDITVEIPVDLKRKPAHGGHKMQHGDKDSHNMHGDPGQIEQLLKAEFDRADAPLTVAPITITGDHAVAGWRQDGQGGRAFLHKTGGVWTVVACAGPEFLEPQAFSTFGMTPDATDTLLGAVRQSEAALPRSVIAQFDSFDGIVEIGAGGHSHSHSH